MHDFKQINTAVFTDLFKEKTNFLTSVDLKRIRKVLK